MILFAECIGKDGQQIQISYDQETKKVGFTSIVGDQSVAWAVEAEEAQVFGILVMSASDMAAGEALQLDAEDIMSMLELETMPAEDKGASH
jgi:hypothetical protein